MAGLLTADDVAFAYGSTSALRGITLSPPDHGSVAIRGLSGSGKSTLLQCLAGLLLPASRHVRYCGRSTAELSEADRSSIRLSDFGFVFQFGYLVPELTLLENTALPGWLGGASRREATMAASRTLDHLGIGDVAGRLPGEVSGGQMQRAAVARAVVHKPRVIFADEPTGALDSANAALVFDTLLQQARDLGALLLVVTHENGLAERCDRTVTMTDGRILEAATLSGPGR
ncbi:MAG: ATP-binding cassette domain-containing protein [Acidimicrobiia bacterium]|nr:ATP-binding cassette domain-containing protein [Acidimicrobiia bacterium]